MPAKKPFFCVSIYRSDANSKVLHNLLEMASYG